MKAEPELRRSVTIVDEHGEGRIAARPIPSGQWRTCGVGRCQNRATFQLEEWWRPAGWLFRSPRSRRVCYTHLVIATVAHGRAKRRAVQGARVRTSPAPKAS